MLCLDLLTHSLLTSCINLHHAQCLNLLVFPNSMFTPLLFFLSERAMCSLEKYHLKITIIIIIMDAMDVKC